jgi:hypothetical protein
MCLAIGGRRVAKTLGVDWPQFQTWLFDAGLIPQDYRERLSGVIATPVEELLQQDWISAASEARKVVSLRTDLAWPFAVLGWSSERSGDVDAAFAYYTAGFTSGWRAKAGLHHKFAAERLTDLDQTLSPPRRNCAYLQALNRNKNPALGAREYWTREGEAAERARQYDRAYRCSFNAGWDLYVSNEMRDVLKRLARVAEASNYRALYELALHHLQSLKTT